MAMKRATLIKRLNKEFPGIGAVDAGDFYGRPDSGIWFRGTESIEIDGFGVMNSYYEPAPRLRQILDAAGWFAEPYDAGTLMAYEG